MNKCKICHSITKPIIAFGQMPIANGFLKKLNQKEFFYNLLLVFCPNCFMVQLGKTVKPEMMFHNDYQFISSTSKNMELHFKKIAKEIMKKIVKKENPFAVELGCNDGIMLKHLVNKKIRHLGVEPSGNVASLARKNKVKVIQDFFNEKTAKKIIKKYGQADIICGSNVFCHIEDINSVFKGVMVLLKENGLLFFEEPYLLDIIKKSSFDQIYDEHVYYYSGLSISNLAKKHGLQLIDMKHKQVHGGSMRYYISKLKMKNKKLKINVNKWISRERQLNLDKIEGYKKFKNKVNEICRQLRQLLINIKKKDFKTVGYGATSKSTTLLNYAKIGPDLIDYISDITPSKIGKFSPGMHIPIKSHKAFIKDKPNYVLLFAWNHKKEIFNKEKEYHKKGGKFITYFPKVKIE